MFLGLDADQIISVFAPPGKLNLPSTIGVLPLWSGGGGG